MSDLGGGGQLWQENPASLSQVGPSYVRAKMPNLLRHDGEGADVRLLAEADATLGQMAGPATREVMRREFEVYGDVRFARLAHISVAHLYNLRKSTTYLRKRIVLDGTRPTRVAIGGGRAPTAGPASCASTPSTRATSTATRAST